VTGPCQECGKRRKLDWIIHCEPRAICRACFRRLYDARKIPKKA